MPNFSKIICHLPRLFFLQKFYRLFLVIPCFHIAKGDIWAPLVSSRGRSHTIPIIWRHHAISHPFANRCWWKMTSAWGSHLGFIRSCQNPIGRAQPKNWNLWLCHIKQRSGKKVDRILCWWYRDWWQSIRGMTREVLKCLLLLYESKEWPKKKHPPTDENGKKHQNRHEMVIHGSKWDVDHTKMIRKTRSTRIRSSYCAKTLKMRV